MALWLGVALAILGSRSAFADHHMATTSESQPDSLFAAAIALGAASYTTKFYGGDYESIVPTLSWSRDRYAVSASLGLYRLEENGLLLYGLGDLVVSGQVRALDVDTTHAGVALAVSAPTANETNGFGMGHPMAMPSVWASTLLGPAIVSASAGYSRALASLGDHVHGMWPLVEPMNMSEITWGAGAEVAVVPDVRVSARVSGGVPIIAAGVDRVIAGVRVGWTTGRVSTAAEVQTGLVGDPFTIRGVLETALRF